MDFKALGTLGGLAVLVSMGVAAFQIAGKVDERHIDALIRAGATVIVIIVLGAFAIMGVLSYLRARAKDRELYGQPQRRGHAYHAPQLPPPYYDYPPQLTAGQDDQGTFVVRDNGHYAQPPQEDWR